MTPTLIDKKWLSAAFPEGFQPIPHDELTTLMGVEYDNLWGVRDTARHMMISVTWKDSNKLLAKLVSEKSLAERVDESFAKSYRKGDYRNGDNGTGNYRNDGYFERAIAGASAQAQGFHFSYIVEGVMQEGEVMVFKRGTRCYTLYYYTRTETAAANSPVYDETIASLEVR